MRRCPARAGEGTIDDRQDGDAREDNQEVPLQVRRRPCKVGASRRGGLTAAAMKPVTNVRAPCRREGVRAWKGAAPAEQEADRGTRRR